MVHLEDICYKVSQLGRVYFPISNRARLDLRYGVRKRSLRLLRLSHEFEAFYLLGKSVYEDA